MAGTVMMALATESELATAVAVTVTCKSLAGGAGAVYVMGTPLRLEVAERVPHVGQETVQVTPLLVVSFTSVAVNATFCVPSTVGAAGATAIPIDGMSRVAEADLVVSVTELPVRITVALLAGGVAGAV